MPELRPRKPSVNKSVTKEKSSSKRKVATNDDASPIAPKKLKKDILSKEKKGPKSATKRKEEKLVSEDDENDENQPSEGEEEAQALARVVDSDAEEDDVYPDEEIKSLELPTVSKEVTKASESNDGEPGVVYIGRIPRGFYEHQMREYFSQFGEVNKVRLSRNKATGQSKHFAFIEFAELAVAEIVAKTMDNYLLAGHILKVKMVPKSQIHEKLWVGANKRFKKIPWNKMAGSKLKKPRSESAWTEKISKEEARRTERSKKLMELGYEFEAPKLKGVNDVDESPAAIEAPEEDAPKAIEAVPQPSGEDIEQPAPVAKTAAKDSTKSGAKPGKKTKRAKKAAS
ncbi:RNA-binding domain-containing protein [Nemania sp. FL0916]|nr:RNA-binding domain-containing protein [Nemania sp. FL0916]